MGGSDRNDVRQDGVRAQASSNRCSPQTSFAYRRRYELRSPQAGRSATRRFLTSATPENPKSSLKRAAPSIRHRSPARGQTILPDETEEGYDKRKTNGVRQNDNVVDFKNSVRGPHAKPRSKSAECSDRKI